MNYCLSKLVCCCMKQKVIYHFFHLSDEGSPNNKKIKVCENEYKSHLISLIFLLITANFPLGPWDRASLCLCHLICRLHISAHWAALSLPSPRPLLAGACGEAGLQGPPLFWLGRKVQRESWKLGSGNIKKKKKTWATASLKAAAFHKQTYLKQSSFRGSN